MHSIAGFRSHLRERHTLEPSFPQECPEPGCAQCFLRHTDLTVHLNRRHYKSKGDPVAVDFSGPWTPAACPHPDCLELPHIVFDGRYSLLYHLLSHHHMMAERGSFFMACLCPYSACPDRATLLESPLPAEESSVTLDDLFGAEPGLSGAYEGATIPDTLIDPALYSEPPCNDSKKKDTSTSALTLTEVSVVRFHLITRHHISPVVSTTIVGPFLPEEWRYGLYYLCSPSELFLSATDLREHYSLHHPEVEFSPQDPTQDSVSPQPPSGESTFTEKQHPCLIQFIAPDLYPC